MPHQNRKEDGPKAPRQTPVKVRSVPTVVVYTAAMTEQQAHRLRTAVDALLAEWVRQQLGRGESHEQ